MIGDKLVLEDKHWRVADFVVDCIDTNQIKKHRFSIAVSGESGTGKSEIAYTISKRLKKKGIKSVIISADDFFHLPAGNKKGQSDWIRRICPQIVGPMEVYLNWMQAVVNEFKDGAKFSYVQISDRTKNELRVEKLNYKNANVIIAEGTHNGALTVDCNVFLEATYIDSRDKRLNKRKRTEAKDKKLAKFIEEIVLPAEHKQVIKNKKNADILVSKDFKNIRKI